MPTYGPFWKSLQSTLPSPSDDEDAQEESPCKKLTSTERVLSVYGGRAIPGDTLRLGDVVHYEGSYDWIGQVVKLTESYGTLLDRRGRLCRVVLAAGDFVLLGRAYATGWDGSIAAEAMYATVAALLRFDGVRQAIGLCQRAPFDPADFDRWLIPLVWYVSAGACLTEPAMRYLMQDAPTRRRYEAAIDLMEGERQREVWVRNVLGGEPCARITAEYQLRDSAVRTARWRARALVRAMAPAMQ